MIGEDTQFPHSLVPLALAVLLVRAKLPGAAGANPNAVAAMIASAVPVFEYWNNPLRLPRPLASALRDGVLGDGGRELRFVDGRPTKYRIAVRAQDVDCVVEMLMHPEHAVCIRNRMLRMHARKLVTTSRGLAARSAELRRVARTLVSQPAYPGAALSP